MKNRVNRSRMYLKERRSGIKTRCWQHTETELNCETGLNQSWKAEKVGCVLSFVLFWSCVRGWPLPTPPLPPCYEASCCLSLQALPRSFLNVHLPTRGVLLRQRILVSTHFICCVQLFVGDCINRGFLLQPTFTTQEWGQNGFCFWNETRGVELAERAGPDAPLHEVFSQCQLLHMTLRSQTAI